MADLSVDVVVEPAVNVSAGETGVSLVTDHQATTDIFVDAGSVTVEPLDLSINVAPGELSLGVVLVGGSQGVPGPQGVTWRGEWLSDGSGDYLINDLVSWQGNVYICTVDHTAGDPTVYTSRWALFTARGERGPTGPSGSGGFVHNQSTPAATWTITHDLGRAPLNCEVSIGDEVVYTDVDYPDTETVVLTFASPQSGTARLI